MLAYTPNQRGAEMLDTQDASFSMEWMSSQLEIAPLKTTMGTLQPSQPAPGLSTPEASFLKPQISLRGKCICDALQLPLRLL
eukprot:5072225-Pleurochrysis_carterae.AAC.8